MKKFISFEFRLMKCLGILLVTLSILNCRAATVTTPMTQNLDGGLYDITNVNKLVVNKDPWADVRAFGADGSDNIDDTVAIQAAIDSGARTIFIPAGTYLISATLNVQDQGLNIKGHGADYMAPGGAYTLQQTTLKWTGVSGGTILKLYKTKRTTVEGIHFYGNSKSAGVGLCLDSDHNPASMGNNIWKCRFLECQIALDIGPNDSVSETDISNCWFSDNTTQIRVTDVDTYDTTIRNTHFYGHNPGTNYILENMAGKVSLINCYFGPVVTAVVHQTGQGWIRMTDCYSESHGAYIAKIEEVYPGAHSLIIDKCTFLQSSVPAEGFLYVTSGVTSTPQIVIRDTYSPKDITIAKANARITVSSSTIGNILGTSANEVMIIDGSKARGHIGTLQGHIAAVGPEASLELSYASSVNSYPDVSQSIVLQNIGSSKLKFWRPGYTQGLTLDFGSYSRQWSHGTSAPGSGYWRVGDIVWNNTPSAGGNIGWVCTSAGTPGTWKTFGAINP